MKANPDHTPSERESDFGKQLPNGDTRNWRPKIGDSGFEVEWCSDIPIDEYGDNDLDNAKYHRRYFRQESDALAYAREVYPKDQFGEVQITPFEVCPDEYAPRLADWQYGESEYYHGEDA